MRYKYRGKLSNGKMVDIFDFENEYAKCDGQLNKIHIDEFNTIFIPRDTFKKDMLGIEVKEVIIDKKKDTKKSK